MGERRLTVRDRIVVHLAGYTRFAEEFECPKEMAQDGISIAIGKSRAHTTLELNRMKEVNLINERLAHVKGTRSKRKTYILTAEALAREREIAKHIYRLEIDAIISGETNIMSGQQAVEALMGALSVSRAIAFDMILASDGKINLDDVKNKQKSDSLIGVEEHFMDPLGSIPDIAPGTEENNQTLDGYILQARILSKKTKPTEALKILEKAINAYSSNPDLSRAYYSRASIFRKQGNFPSALKDINKSMAMATESDEKLAVGRCQMEKAMILYGTGNSQQSLKLLNSAQNCFQQEDSQVDVLRCGINKGMILRGLGMNEEAINVLEESLALAEKTGLDRLKAYALVNLTDLLNMQENYEQSKELGYISRDIFMALDEPLMLAASLFNLGTAQAGLGEKKEAISNLDNAVSILEKNDMLTSRTDWLEKYADILEELGEGERAKSIINKI